MKEELETLVTQVKALLTECLQGWLQALSQGDSVDDPASLGQLAVQLSTAYSTCRPLPPPTPAIPAAARRPLGGRHAAVLKPRHDTRAPRVHRRGVRACRSRKNWEGIWSSWRNAG